MDLQELKTTLLDLQQRVDEIKINVLKIESKESRLKEIEKDLAKEEVWSDLELSQKLSKEKTALENGATELDVEAAQLMADQIMEMARMMGLENDHNYVQNHVKIISDAINR